MKWVRLSAAVEAQPIVLARSDCGALWIELIGRPVSLRPSGALWIEGERILVAGDLHLEKGSSYAARGQLLPPYDTRATLDRLEAEIAVLTPRTVVLLGDSFHDARAVARLAPDDARRIANLGRGLDLIWAVGNHDDEGLAAFGPALPGVIADEIAVAGLTLRHEPRAGLQPGEVSGHLHPLRQDRLARPGCASACVPHRRLPPDPAGVRGLCRRAERVRPRVRRPVRPAAPGRRARRRAGASDRLHGPLRRLTAVGWVWVIATVLASRFQGARNGLKRSLTPQTGPWGIVAVIQSPAFALKAMRHRSKGMHFARCGMRPVRRASAFGSSGAACAGELPCLPVPARTNEYAGIIISARPVGGGATPAYSGQSPAFFDHFRVGGFAPERAEFERRGDVERRLAVVGPGDRPVRGGSAHRAVRSPHRRPERAEVRRAAKLDRTGLPLGQRLSAVGDGGRVSSGPLGRLRPFIVDDQRPTRRRGFLLYRRGLAVASRSSRPRQGRRLAADPPGHGPAGERAGLLVPGLRPDRSGLVRRPALSAMRQQDHGAGDRLRQPDPAPSPWPV